MDLVSEWGGLWTTSMPISTCPHLWNVLSYGCNIDKWRVALHENGYLASSYTAETPNHTIIHQQLLSNGFNGVPLKDYELAVSENGK
jgi:hypothetical protein